jgi:hypothetical protein
MTTTIDISNDVEVEVHNYKKTNPTAARWNLSEGDSETEIIWLRDSIKSVTVSKTKSEPYGQFTITLMPTENWLRRLVGGSWLSIYMKTSPLTTEDLSTNRGAYYNEKTNTCALKMIGIIISIRAKFSINEVGAQEIRYEISGYDFGYLLTSTVLINNLYAGGNADAPIITLIQEKMGEWKGFSSPDVNLGYVFSTISELEDKMKGEIKDKVEILPKYLAVVPSSFSSYFNATEDSFVKMLKTCFGTDERKGEDKDISKNNPKTLLGGKPYAPLSLMSSPTIWEFILEYSNTLLNECIVDLMVSNGKVVPSFIVRQMPFTTSNFSSLVKEYKTEEFPVTYYSTFTRTPIDSSLLIGYDIGTTEQERTTYVNLIGRLGTMQAESAKALTQVANPQIIDKEAIKRFGMRPVVRDDVDYSYVSKTGDSFKFLQWSAILADWWFFSHRYGNGTFDFIGLDKHIAVGENIEITGWGMVGHIEGYTHTFTVNEKGERLFRTSVSASRLVDSDSDYANTYFLNGNKDSSKGSVNDNERPQDKHSSQRTHKDSDK